MAKILDTLSDKRKIDRAKIKEILKVSREQVFPEETEQGANGLSSMDITRELNEVELGDLAGEISPEAMSWLATKLDFNHAEIQTEREKWRENMWEFKMHFLVSWKYKENGPDARKVFR